MAAITSQTVQTVTTTIVAPPKQATIVTSSTIILGSVSQSSVLGIRSQEQQASDVDDWGSSTFTYILINGQ